MTDKWKARTGMCCPECSGTETFQIASPVCVSEFDIRYIEYLLECHTCDTIYSTLPF